MAHLREQAKIVKLVVDCPHDLRNTYNERRRDYSSGITKALIIDYFLSHTLFLNEKNKDLNNLTDAERHKRQRDIETLIESCEPNQDNFIRPVIDEYQEVNQHYMATAGRFAAIMENPGELPMVTRQRDNGYYATSKGTDLLTFMGFWGAVFKKHQLLFGGFVGVFLSAIFGTAKWILENPEKIQHAFEVLKSIHVGQ